MKKLPQSLKVKNEQGNVAIIVALSIVAFISFTALSIDIGYALVTRNQLQNVADSAALAATRRLSHDYYDGKSFPDQQAVTVAACRSTLVTTAQQAAAANIAGGKYITSINDSDIIIGQWHSLTKSLTPDANPPDAVKVTARRDASANAPITTFFAGIFGTKQVSVTASATAALTAQSTAPQGRIPFPAGISDYWFSAGGGCNQPIQFYPTGSLSGCAGWHTYTTSPSNASTLKTILKGLTDGTFQTPETLAGQTLYAFTGGTVASDFNEMKNLFDAMRVKNDGVFDLDTNPNTWTTTVIVYDRNDCSNPTGTLTVLGFATATITSVVGSPSKVINAVVACNSFVTGGRGGGSDYGSKGTIPGLVQ